MPASAVRTAARRPRLPVAASNSLAAAVTSGCNPWSILGNDCRSPADRHCRRKAEVELPRLAATWWTVDVTPWVVQNPSELGWCFVIWLWQSACHLPAGYHKCNALVKMCKPVNCKRFIDNQYRLQLVPNTPAGTSRRGLFVCECPTDCVQFSSTQGRLPPGGRQWSL